MGLCLSEHCDAATTSRLRSAPLREADLDAPYPPPALVGRLVDRVIKCVVTKVLEGNRCIILFVEDGRYFRQPVCIDDYEPLAASGTVPHLESLLLGKTQSHPLLFAKILSVPNPSKLLRAALGEALCAACRAEVADSRFRIAARTDADADGASHATSDASAAAPATPASAASAAVTKTTGHQVASAHGQGAGVKEDAYGRGGGLLRNVCSRSGCGGIVAREDAGAETTADLRCALYLDPRCRRSIADAMVQAGVGTTIKDNVYIPRRRPPSTAREDDDDTYVAFYFPSRPLKSRHATPSLQLQRTTGQCQA